MNTLEEFIEYSLSSKTLCHSFNFHINDNSINRIRNITNLNISKYKFTIKEEYVRHVFNRHPGDIKYLIQLPNIINTFDEVEKSIIRNNRTGQNEVSLVFRKKLDSNKVQTVALRVFNKKELSLKTLFTIKK
jgi:hypothetical protein